MSYEASETMADDTERAPAPRLKKSAGKQSKETMEEAVEVQTETSLQKLDAAINRAVDSGGKLKYKEINVFIRDVEKNRNEYIDNPDLVKAFNRTYDKYVNEKRLKEDDIKKRLGKLNESLKKAVLAETADEGADGKSEQGFLKKTFSLFADPFVSLKNLVLGKRK
jgi:enamine deaminase RidA (YjgF/YER057c/UK114 family)